MLDGMNVAIDKLGRIVVPKPVRDRLGLHAGTEMDLSATADALVLRPLRRQPGLIQVDGILVHQGQPQGDLSRAVEEARDARIRELSDFSG